MIRSKEQEKASAANHHSAADRPDPRPDKPLFTTANDPQRAAAVVQGRRRRALLAFAALLALALLFVTGYFLGQLGRSDPETIIEQRSAAGLAAGKQAGRLAGLAAGQRRGRDSAYRRAYRQAYRQAYQRALSSDNGRDLGLAAPGAKES